MSTKAFHLVCTGCGEILPDFSVFLAHGQACPSCARTWFDIPYADYAPLKKAVARKSGLFSIWQYKDLLPVRSDRSIVSAGEGAVAIERWGFLERFAKESAGLDLRVYAHRHDNCNATGTFKDLAASVAASVLKENGVSAYVVSSTGNIGVAYSRYFAQAGIPLYVFIPRESSRFHAAEIACFGQKVFQVDGDYRQAKALASAFARREGLLPMNGSFDPMRLEAKKTMAYEWIRQMDMAPTVYIQALSGGTGPVGVHAGCRDLVREGLLEAFPRFILAQSRRCAPMAEAWSAAREAGFPEGWERTYPVYENPATDIVTLSTGDPTAYPTIGPMVRKTGGCILAVPEAKAVDYARLVAFESAVRIGPAAAIAVGGFFQALAEGELRQGDVVLVNIGEGMRRAPDFMEKMLHSLSPARTLDDCALFERSAFRDRLWQGVTA